MRRTSMLPPGPIRTLAFALAILGLPAATLPALGAAGALETGACCFADGHCTVLTQDDCTQQGGQWQGPDTNCSPNPCPGCLAPCASGACCLQDGACLWTIQSACQTEGGVFQGENTVCYPNPCRTASTPAPDVKDSGTTWGKLRMMYR